MCDARLKAIKAPSSKTIERITIFEYRPSEMKRDFMYDVEISPIPQAASRRNNSSEESQDSAERRCGTSPALTMQTTPGADDGQQTLGLHKRHHLLSKAWRYAPRRSAQQRH